MSETRTDPGYDGPQQRPGDPPRPIVVSDVRSTYPRRPGRWKHATPLEWGDWKWQQQQRIRSLDALEDVLQLTPGERRTILETRDRFRLGITPHYAALIDHDNPTCPIRAQAVPNEGELLVWPFELEDPLAEERYMPVPGITHRYPDRVLFYVTHHCPVYCRHCTRKRKVSAPDSAPARQTIDRGIEYIRNNPAIRDVLVSGGDPLTLSNERLRAILQRLRDIEHLDVIRLGTRNPVTLPQRIDDELCTLLAEVAPIYLHTHFNHPAEVTVEAADALDRLRSAGCVLGNQMVLLAGVNDTPEPVEALNRWLLRHGCRPYYIFQADMAQGITHFRTPLARGIALVEALQGRLGGPGVPRFVIDLPGGGGKIMPQVARIVRTEGNSITFLNWQGDPYVFHDVDGAGRAELDEVVDSATNALTPSLGSRSRTARDPT